MEFDVKKALKDAKEQLKNKDYNNVLENCKLILKQEKNNYLGWLLSGAAFQGLEQADKAIAALNKATQLQPEQLPAWQGLASALEQERLKTVISTDNGSYLKETCAKLMLVYTKLEEFYSGDPGKLMQVQKKECELYASVGDIGNCLDKAKTLLLKNDKETILSTLKVLLPLTPKFDTSTLEMLEEIIGSVIGETELNDTIALQENYLNILLQLKKESKACNAALKILEVEQNNLKALQTLCKIYIYEKNLQVSSAKMNESIERLQALQPNNKDALLAKARWYITNHQPQQAKSLLDNIQKTGKSLISEVLLCEVFELLCSWSSMEVVCHSILGSTDLKDGEDFYWKLKLIKSMLKQKVTEKLELAGEIISSSSHIDSNSLKIWKVLLDLRTNKEAAELPSKIKELESSNVDKQEVTLLKLEYSFKTGNIEEAVAQLDSALLEFKDNAYFTLESAKLLWPFPHLQGKGIALFLNVIKINREIAEPYIYLGTFYGQQRGNEASMQRSARCLEKAFQLQSNNQNVAQKLFDSYIALNDNSNAQKLLDVVIKLNPKGCRWAWLKKGYLHLKKFRHETQVLEKEREAGRAVMCFQNALDMGMAEASTYENLGDAYAARGSYSAALKAFQRALELNPDSTYALYQAAAVKQTLGEFAVATAEFEILLGREPNYLPALKGLADTLLCQAEEFLVDGFTGRVVDCCSRAFEVLVKAVQQNPHYVCLWSQLGRITLMLYAIPERDFNQFHLPKQLLQDIKEEKLTKHHIMKLGVKFLLSALHLTSEVASLWHNLGLSYYYCSLIQHSDSDKSCAIAAAKKAITYEPSEPLHWDLLGLASDQPAVKQHAFIRAIELNPNSLRAAKSWTNLGTLYLQHDNPVLAHECFRKAQNLDPFYVAAWISQGNVADLLSPSDAMDLFRHSLSIGSGNPGQCEGAPAYAHWVINMLADADAKSLPSYRYSIVQMHAVTTAIDGLVKYVALYPEDGCALNLLGLLYERQGLLSRAEEAFLQGIEYVSRDESQANIARIDKLKANLARIYTTCGRCDEATELYATLQESELSSVCGIALAHFKANRHAEAYITYEAALDWLASDEENKSHLLVAMAMAAFRRDFPDPEAARDLLYQSSGQDPPSVYGLLALCALGLLTDDDTLIFAAVDALQPYRAQPRYVADISALLAFKEFSSGNELQGRREIMRNVHLLPNVTDMWVLLTTYLTNVAAASERPRWFDGLLVARSAESAVFARRENESCTDVVFKPMDFSQVISLNSIGYLLAGQGKNSLIAAKKAVHCNPHSAASWSALLAAALPYWATPANDDKLTRLAWLKKLIEHLRRHCDVTSYSRLAPWLGNYERRLISMLSH